LAKGGVGKAELASPADTGGGGEQRKKFGNAALRVGGERILKRRWSISKIYLEDVLEQLNGLKVAILVTDGFEEVEMVKPRQALVDAGADARIVSPKSGKVKAWASTEWGQEYPVDVELEQARPQDFEALVLPGGVMNPDKLRIDAKAVEFVRSFFEEGKPVAVICHGPWTLIEAGVASGRRITSWPSLKTDLRNSGARWVDEEVVVDGTLVSSRKPDDLPAFVREMIKLFSSAGGRGQRAA